MSLSSLCVYFVLGGGLEARVNDGEELLDGRGEPRPPAVEQVLDLLAEGDAIVDVVVLVHLGEDVLLELGEEAAIGYAYDVEYADAGDGARERVLVVAVASHD